jgi:hypothetical protein
MRGEEDLFLSKLFLYEIKDVVSFVLKPLWLSKEIHCMRIGYKLKTSRPQKPFAIPLFT